MYASFRFDIWVLIPILCKLKRKCDKIAKTKLNETKKKTIFTRFIEQMKNVMIIILLLAALVSFSQKARLLKLKKAQ